MKKVILIAIIGAFTLNTNAGDWGGGKAVAPKAPIVVGCPDTNGYVTVGYDTDYVYKGYRFGTDTAHLGVGYTIETVVPITISASHYNLVGSRNTTIVSSPGLFAPSSSIGGGFLFGLEDVTEVGLSAQIASIAGVDVSLGYTHRFYSGSGVTNVSPPNAGFEDTSTTVLPSHSSNGEITLGLAKDLGFARAHFDLSYNLNAPDSWNTQAPLAGGQAETSGAWFWDLGLDKEIGVTDNISLILGAGVTYADNYWGGALSTPTFNPAALTLIPSSGTRSSGWNNYYLRASLPIQINCKATITPYIGYSGAPDGFLMDGATFGGSTALTSQSDILHGGVSMTVKF